MARTLDGRESSVSCVRVAILACTNVIGGHECQAAALGRSLAEHTKVTVFVNHAVHAGVFQEAGLDVQVAADLLLGPGVLPRQYFNGWRSRTVIRTLVEGFDHVIISAGAVEAGVAVGVALRGHLPTSMYLPSFFDRVPVWGWKGHLYNCILASTCRLFDRVITINRIQSCLIRGFLKVQTVVVQNQVRSVDLPSERPGRSRLVFIGRLDPQKRVGELISWLDYDGNPFKELLILGDGPLRPELEEQARSCSFLRCAFLGWISAQAQDALLNSNDILILNSLVEGEPLVVREAKKRGMQVIARDIVGVRGVTRPFQRYCDALGLRTRLQVIATQGAGLDMRKALTKNNDSLRRSSEIARLAALLAG